MYKLLIVDDEPTVRLGLGTYFNWSSFGIALMGEADDGDVALEMVEKEQPDLILTDVRMPNLDGLTMAKKVSEKYPHCKIIFVSGHDDADYLKSALKVSAADYIFKPVNLQELTAVIRRVVAEMDNDRAEQLQKRDLLVKLKEGMPLLREKFLLSLLASSASKADLRERVSFLGLNLPLDGAYWVMVISIDDMAEVMGSRTERDRQLLWYSVQNISEELIGNYLGGYVFEFQNGEFACILRAEGDQEQADSAEALFALAGEIRTNLEKYLKIGVTIGISDQVDELSALSAAYKQAREAADYKWYLGKNRIITMDSLENRDSEEGRLSRYDWVYNEQLISALKADDEAKLRGILDEIFADLNRNRRDGLKYGRNVCLQIVLAAGQILLEISAQSSELESSETVLWEALFEKETLEEMRLLIEAYLSAVRERIREKRSGKLANVVERVKAVIGEQYSNGALTVSEIAKAVYLSPTYVSLLFKQDTGQTINEYLTHVRVEKAKELLSDPQYKFYDICYAIGYTDPSYFTKLFKKATGVTPSVYRDQYA
ncbi:response regulator [Paenibacillus sp. HB172176]|uniref:response regulator n=1 Tax=Paenibacillus sp. HB172176 TaxID=2493690 RepID=UPI00143A0803|nr:response regulator [Paenibacillus sp. HB172176]